MDCLNLNCFNYLFYLCICVCGSITDKSTVKLLLIRLLIRVPSYSNNYIHHCHIRRYMQGRRSTTTKLKLMFQFYYYCWPLFRLEDSKTICNKTNETWHTGTRSIIQHKKLFNFETLTFIFSSPSCFIFKYRSNAYIIIGKKESNKICFILLMEMMMRICT